MTKRKKKVYALREGMVLEKKYKGRPYSLHVVKESGRLQFRLGKTMVPSLTAAAKHVCDGEHAINGPWFWGAPTE
jgi:hypothetical protein